MPRPGFPRTIVEFQARFPDDTACREYLFASRWPDRDFANFMLEASEPATAPTLHTAAIAVQATFTNE